MEMLFNSNVIDMKGLHKRTYGSWEPVDENAKKIFSRFKFGDIVGIEIKQQRNTKFHRKFFAMINLTFKNQEITDSIDDFREAVTIAAGFYYNQRQIDGSEIKRAKSISFSKMDDLTFADLYNKVFNVCLNILGCKSEELEKELLHFD